MTDPNSFCLVALVDGRDEDVTADVMEMIAFARDGIEAAEQADTADAAGGRLALRRLERLLGL